MQDDSRRSFKRNREAKMTKLILTCSCHRMDKKAITAFKTLFPDTPVPRIIMGRDNLYKFAKSLTPQNDHILAISKLSGRFAYYVEMEDSTILQEWDLQTGKRIA